ncbi:isocitrate lyase/PEP mutase family protein [Solemya velesiana gill symbiont]|uniref:Carboxyvinyl-carboxyphosphonate phosphorylmutase n=1 Tax=Solemya velesiana gill symbiont TaxID=1918948 RepID=A0A1T2KYE5_9GAMM|nr:isocitrate lyase/PEP mutase family protein [Solemya velesiana gill symbiont]OOZ37879.1 carboxyvinyl-carboxyphosphonate phosphorylmutase [Solemya velesiana gill symbiont]
MPNVTSQLHTLLEQPGIITMPCCFDAFSAKLIEQAGFPLTFMSGFAVSAARLGLPDTGLISAGEMVDQGRNICSAVEIPVIGDGDTGYGNPMNVRCTVKSYAEAGFACIMIEDQEAPKRCGHTRGKRVVDRREATNRIKAAVAQKEAGSDVMIMARTDARHEHGMEEALWRCQAFADLGADIIFLEAPQTVDEMARFCRETPGYKMAHMVEQGDTPVLPPAELESIGYKIAAYPLTLISSAATAMLSALDALKRGKTPDRMLEFSELRALVGFNAYDEELKRYDI